MGTQRPGELRALESCRTAAGMELRPFELRMLSHVFNMDQPRRQSRPRRRRGLQLISVENAEPARREDHSPGTCPRVPHRAIAPDGRLSQRPRRGVRLVQRSADCGSCILSARVRPTTLAVEYRPQRSRSPHGSNASRRWTLRTANLLERLFLGAGGLNIYFGAPYLSHGWTITIASAQQHGTPPGLRPG
jgi:hypothetical protein